jgi:tetratricopeptide (TPR) repeat protein
VHDLLLGLLGALLATNQVAATSNLVKRTTGVSLPLVDPNDPVEAEYQKLLEADDDARTEVDRWIQENDAFAAKGAGLSSAELNQRIDQRFETVVRAYEDFIRQHPNHARVRLAYGSFLNETGKEFDAMVQWERARELDAGNPAAWNNLADYYSHRGPVRKAFEYLAKAIELDPKEPVYYHNLATIVFLFRKDALELYGLDDERKVFARALDLYRQARKLDPDNFTLATELAQTYYFLKPAPVADQQALEEEKRKLVDEGLQAWLDAQKIAPGDLERESVSIHMARWCLTNGRLGQARRHLDDVNHPNLAGLKARITRNLEQKEKETRPPD